MRKLIAASLLSMALSLPVSAQESADVVAAARIISKPSQISLETVQNIDFGTVYLPDSPTGCFYKVDRDGAAEVDTSFNNSSSCGVAGTSNAAAVTLNCIPDSQVNLSATVERYLIPESAGLLLSSSAEVQIDAQRWWGSGLIFNGGSTFPCHSSGVHNLKIGGGLLVSGSSTPYNGNLGKYIIEASY